MTDSFGFGFYGSCNGGRPGKLTVNAAISVMAVFKVRLSFSGMIFETGLSLHFTGLQLSGDRWTVFTGSLH